MANELTLCDREPIHVPGSIQPHGLMLVAARDGLLVRQVAGDVEGWLGVEDWHGTNLATLIGADLAARVVDYCAAEQPAGAAPRVAFLGQLHTLGGGLVDVSVFTAAHVGPAAGPRDLVVVELEAAAAPSLSAAELLNRIEEASSAFQRAAGLEGLCRAATTAFRRLTGFDRVMIYRFLDDDAGQVLAEDKRADWRSFLNHHFPAGDIPRQARALYLRNLVRVIPDIHYTPAPLRPATPDEPLDLSDSFLRSVSPVHLQYAANLGVGATASVSIVKDAVLWGLVACHNEQPRALSFDIRTACRSLAAALSRELKGKEDAEGYRERLRLRSFEDDLVRLLARDMPLEEVAWQHIQQVQRVKNADGVAMLRGEKLLVNGATPPQADLRELAGWLLAAGPEPVRASDSLETIYPKAASFRDVGSGMLSVVISTDEPWLIMWFRGELVETVNWAGNPHTSHQAAAGEQLTPRASFDAWAEMVRGRSRRWSLAEIDSAARLREAVLEAQHNRRLADLNRQLTELVRVKDSLLVQKEYLIGEVNHRVQNSLQLVSSFLALQARGAADPSLKASLDEAGRRLAAVGLVHRRLYRGDQVETIDAARYIEELCHDTLATMGAEWRAQLTLDLAHISITTDRAVTLGLVLTELMINVNKYAYGGDPGPLEIALKEDRAKFRLSVADRGIGRQSDRQGFGSRMMAALVQQLGGEFDYEDNCPGLRAVLTASAGDTRR